MTRNSNATIHWAQCHYSLSAGCNILFCSLALLDSMYCRYYLYGKTFWLVARIIFRKWCIESHILRKSFSNLLHFNFVFVLYYIWQSIILFCLHGIFITLCVHLFYFTFAISNMPSFVLFVWHQWSVINPTLETIWTCVCCCSPVFLSIIMWSLLSLCGSSSLQIV